MPQTADLIASGPGWRVSRVVCTDGPHDPSFEEQHGDICIAAVLDGVFRYRGTQGDALMAPGSLLLGNRGQAFECGHDHSQGDHCLCFNLAPQFLETIITDIPGAKHLGFKTPRLPPSPRLIPLMASGIAASQSRDASALEEITVRLAAYTVAEQTGASASLRLLSHEEHIVAQSVQVIEAELSELSNENLSLATLSRRFGLSPYRFLRLFHRILGMTPHQYVLHLRLNRAAQRLLTTEDEISAVAFDEGFADLSTFNRRFRKLTGKTPGQFRRH